MEERKNKLKARHTFTVFPQDLNYSGSLFGGKLMQEMDIAASNCVRRILYGTGADGCVTASVDKIDFLNPAFLGDFVIIDSVIKSIGRSSFQVRVTVNSESTTGETDLICNANFTFVAIKDKKSWPHGLSIRDLE